MMNQKFTKDDLSLLLKNVLFSFFKLDFNNSCEINKF